jgi:hypothetical protein
MKLFNRDKKRTVTMTPGRIALVGLAGATLWVLSDTRRRSLARDKITKLFNQGTSRIKRRGAYVASTAAGKAEALRHAADTVPPSDPALAAKVSGEVLGDFPGININVEHGVVVLRGQLEDSDRIADLEQGVRKVTGVVDVRNLVHLPGETPPNLPESGS